jgi:hypothetical protein
MCGYSTLPRILLPLIDQVEHPLDGLVVAVRSLLEDRMDATVYQDVPDPAVHFIGGERRFCALPGLRL